MSMHLHRAIDALKKQILELSALVESCVYKALKAVETSNLALAQEVIKTDSAIDLAEVEVEEECLKILALHQPVATDLRFIVAVLKINNDLERIGDLAVNIASRATALSKITTPPLAYIDFQDVQAKVQQMLRHSLEALVNLDENLARSVCAADDSVDEVNRSVHKQVLKNIREHPSDADRFILLLSVSRNLERIADHATNIAEDVVYMIRGEIVRHTNVA
jgi:phosphate transport system protein